MSMQQYIYHRRRSSLPSLPMRNKENDTLDQFSLNTLDQALRFARSFSQEIKNDSKSRRIYRTFAALTDNQFEALLAFSIWKVRGVSARFL